MTTSTVPFDRPENGRAVLIRGPPMSGKFDLLLRTLAETDNAILLSTGKPAAQARETFAEYGDSSTLGVVDCITGDDHREAQDGPVRYVSSPQNLTELGVKFTDLAEAFVDGDDVAVGLHSLSELLMYWEPRRVYQFIQVLLGQVRESEWGAVAVLDDAAADEQTIHTLTAPFDVLVDTRTHDGTRELRVRRRGAVETAWSEF